MDKERLTGKGELGQEKIIKVNEKEIKDHLDEIVRGTVEETLNAMLEAEAERLVNAGRYERTENCGRMACAPHTRNNCRFRARQASFPPYQKMRVMPDVIRHLPMKSLSRRFHWKIPDRAGNDIFFYTGNYGGIARTYL